MVKIIKYLTDQNGLKIDIKCYILELKKQKNNLKSYSKFYSN